MNTSKGYLISGVLSVTKRLDSSYNGNPRFQVSIGDHGVFKTQVDATLGYSIGNNENKTVNAMVGSFYGSPHVFDVELSK